VSEDDAGSGGQEATDMAQVIRDDRFGLVVNADGAWPDAAELRALGARCVRTTVNDFDQFDAALRAHSANVRVIALLNPVTGGDQYDLTRWHKTVRAFANRFAGRVWALECLSGWDRRGVTPATAVACARGAAQILRDAGSGIACVLGAVSGPSWMVSLQEASRLLSSDDRDLLRGAGFHPYGRNAHGFPGFDHTRFEHGEIDIAVQNAHDIIQLPIWATEFGVTLRQAGGEAGQAAYVRDALKLLGDLPRSVLAAATYFSWSDAVGVAHQQASQSLGLRRGDLLAPWQSGEPRLAWYAFAEAAGGTGSPPEIATQRPSVCI
jgi:hypothetical protein